MKDYEHIVEYDKYCNKCKHKEVAETEEPCDSCLADPTNSGTRKPINFEKMDVKDKL